MTEGEMDREMSAIIGRVVRAEATDADLRRLSDLQIQRARLMMPQRPRRLR